MAQQESVRGAVGGCSTPNFSFSVHSLAFSSMSFWNVACVTTGSMSFGGL